MNALEWRTAGSLAAIYVVRMLGLFMILPVFAKYPDTHPEVTTMMVAVMFAVYGLTQGLLQIPLGLLSDRIGRKPVIVGGLVLFAIGSFIAALTDDIYIMTLGRALQGMGAIAAATMALAADLTREDHRAKVMSVIGMSIGIAFMLAMLLGPIIHQYSGLQGIFWVTTVLAMIGIVLVIFIVPRPKTLYVHRDAGIVQGYLRKVIKNHSLLRMNFGVFVLHLIMAANFNVIPRIFEKHNITDLETWKIYLPVFLLSFLLTVPFIVIAEKKRQIKLFLILFITTIVIAELLLGLSNMHWLLKNESWWLLIFAFSLFFVGFNFLEASQPSLVAKYSDVNTKGTAMGVFTSSQFFGIFIGGIAGGYISTHFGYASVFYFSGMMALIWLLSALGLAKPQFYSAKIVKLKPVFLQDKHHTIEKLHRIAGVKEVSIALNEGVAYLKIDKKILDSKKLHTFSAFEIR